MTSITCWPSLYRPAEGRRVSLRALLARVAAPRTYATKDEIPRWSFGTFRENYRNLDSFISAAGIALDFDAGASLEQLSAAFGDLAGFVHTSWSSTLEVPRCRVALLLDRPVTRDEHDRVWRAGAALAERAGLAPDMAARDASRCWALPAQRPGYQHVELRGAFLDVAQALTAFPAPRPLPEPEHGPLDDLDHRIARASKYIAAMPPAISGSGGHAATFRVAVVLVRGFALPPDIALELLVQEYNPRCAPAWSTWELKHKVRQALQRGRLPVGAIADRTRAA